MSNPAVTQTAQPTLIVGSLTTVVDGFTAISLRMPKDTTEGRTLGARAILIRAPGLSEPRLRALIERALDTFDQSAGANFTERARNIIVSIKGETTDATEVCMVGAFRREAWAAASGELSAVAFVMRESRHSSISLPAGAPGAGARSAQRQGVTTGRISLSPGDRIALAATKEEARALLKRGTGASGGGALPELLLAIEETVATPARSAAVANKTLLSLPADHIVQAKARARARWEEGNRERTELISAAIPPKPTADGRRPNIVTEPYTPIDRAAQEVIAARRGGGPRNDSPLRGPAAREPQPTRESRSREALRRAARARAERSPGAEPGVERSAADRGSGSPSRLRAMMAKILGAIERRLPWLTARAEEPSLDIQRRRERSPEVAKRQGRQRSATLLLLAVLITALGGAASVYLNRTNPTLDAAAAARAALAEAKLAVEEALDPTANLIENDPDRARTLLVAAMEQLMIAETGAAASEISALRARIEPALDRLFLLTKIEALEVFDFTSATVPIKITAITQGPDGFSYILDDYSGAVYRVDPTAQPNPRATVIYQPGYDLFGSKTGRAQSIFASGPDVLILDASSSLWRWRPADKSGRGTLVKLRVRDGELWGGDIKIISGFAADEVTGLYNIYVVDPSARQILRYTPAPDGTGYPAPPTGYLINSASLASVDSMAIDGDLYLAQDGAIRRYVRGAIDDWAPADPGDGVLRSAPEIRLIFSAGASRTGLLYAWDARNQRVIAYSKGASGGVIAQYQFLAEDGPVSAIVGGYISLARDGGAPTFVWAEEGRIRSAVLGVGITPGGEPNAAPTAVPVIELPSSQP